MIRKFFSRKIYIFSLKVYIYNLLSSCSWNINGKKLRSRHLLIKLSRYIYLGNVFESKEKGQISVVLVLWRYKKKS